MIGVTERAKQELMGLLLVDNLKKPGTCVRLGTNQEGKMGLAIDIERPDDKAVEYKGVKLLIVEPKLADTLENVAIDIVNGDEGKQFVIIKVPKSR